MVKIKINPSLRPFTSTPIKGTKIKKINDIKKRLPKTLKEFLYLLRKEKNYKYTK